MKRIIRLTESDLARIVKRVMNEHPLKQPLSSLTRATNNLKQKPVAKDYFVNENYTKSFMDANVYTVTAVGAPTPIKDGTNKSIQVTVSGIKYFSRDGTTYEKSGSFTNKLQHRCGSQSNRWPESLYENDRGSAAFISKMGGSLEVLSNNYCNKVGVRNQKSEYIANL
jgi:hypothetical protein